MIKFSSLTERFMWHTGATTIMYVTALHLCWATLILVSPATEATTPLQALVNLFGEGRILSAMFLVGAAFATVGAYYPSTLVGVMCMLPQQALLVIAASGAAEAVVRGSYPDGVIRPWIFILADQVSLILLAPAYTLAVLSYHQAFRKLWRI